jgi:hypothetical protein
MEVVLAQLLLVLMHVHATTADVHRLVAGGAHILEGVV